MKWAKAIVWISLAPLLWPSSAFACAACFGRSDSAMAKGMNAGIFTLMGVLVTVLIGAASFIFYLVRKSRPQTARAKAPRREFMPAAPVAEAAKS